MASGSGESTEPSGSKKRETAGNDDKINNEKKEVVLRHPDDHNVHETSHRSLFPGLSPAPSNISILQQGRIMAQGMLDIALFSANANQLRYVLSNIDHDTYYYISIVLISLSLLFQVLVGIGLVFNSIYDQSDIGKADDFAAFTVIAIYIVTVVNVFIASFGVANTPVPPLRK